MHYLNIVHDDTYRHVNSDVPTLDMKVLFILNKILVCFVAYLDQQYIYSFADCQRPLLQCFFDPQHTAKTWCCDRNIQSLVPDVATN